MGGKAIKQLESRKQLGRKISIDHAIHQLCLPEAEHNSCLYSYLITDSDRDGGVFGLFSSSFFSGHVDALMADNEQMTRVNAANIHFGFLLTVSSYLLRACCHGGRCKDGRQFAPFQKRILGREN